VTPAESRHRFAHERDAIEAQHSNDVLQYVRETNERGREPFTAEAGSPTRRELVDCYEAETGRSFENERFYRALAAFLLALVWADLHRYAVEAGAESEWPPYVEYGR
jgi:aminoglycoside phosphotransferase (APT) family kinase protein